MQPRSSNRPPHLNLKTSSYSFLPLCNRASHNLFNSSNLTNSRKQMLWSLIQRRQLLGTKCSTWLEWLQQLSLRHRNKRQKIVSRLTIVRSCQGRFWQVATVLQLNSLLNKGPQLRGEKERLGIWKQLPNDWSISWSIVISHLDGRESSSSEGANLYSPISQKIAWFTNAIRVTTPLWWMI